LPPSKPGTPERVFTSTHGVTFADTGPKGEYHKWAQFAAAPHRREPNGPLVFEFATSDPAVAERLLAEDRYGITEVTP
jgi:hypothetical protein